MQKQGFFAFSYTHSCASVCSNTCGIGRVSFDSTCHHLDLDSLCLKLFCIIMKPRNAEYTLILKVSFIRSFVRSFLLLASTVCRTGFQCSLRPSVFRIAAFGFKWTFKIDEEGCSSKVWNCRIWGMVTNQFHCTFIQWLFVGGGGRVVLAF